MLDNDIYSSPIPSAGKGFSAERALRSAIVHGVLKPGQRLSEAALCAEFAIGRGAVRAALAQLQASGFVSSSARSGWQVTPVSAAEIRETVTARKRLEPLLATIALSDADRAYMMQLGDMYAALGSRSQYSPELAATRRRYERDMQDLLATRLGMPTIADWLADLWDRSMRLVLFFEARSPSKLKPADRSALAEALAHGDVAIAEDLIVSAVEDLEGYLAARFLESGAVLAEPAERRSRKTETKSKPAPQKDARQRPKSSQ